MLEVQNAFRACSRSLKDRISDSGSDGPGSIPSGSTDSPLQQPVEGIF